MKPFEREVYDVCVVGAGPSGTTCAHDLARSTMSVVVLEQKPQEQLYFGGRLARAAECAGAQVSPGFKVEAARRMNGLWTITAVASDGTRRHICAKGLIAADGGTITRALELTHTFHDGLLVVGDAAGQNMVPMQIEGGAIAARTMTQALALGDLSATYLARYEERCHRAFLHLHTMEAAA